MESKKSFLEQIMPSDVDLDPEYSSLNTHGRIKTFGEILKDKKNAQSFKIADYGLPGLDELTEGICEGELISVSGLTKQGKCHKKGTELLMFDGTIRCVENVKEGDKLMGDDSTPRTVLNTCSGVDKLFKIIPWQGEPYSVNKEHILCLQRTRRAIKRKDGRKPDRLGGAIIEISVSDYLVASEGMKHILKTYRVPVNFIEREVPFAPYLLGLWLGDGTSAKNKNRFLEMLKRLNLIGNKHIPHTYKCNSEKNRLELLAGLIDTDGCHLKSTRGGALEYSSKNERLINDIAYLCRSLGFACTPRKRIKRIKSIAFVGEYWVMRISGDISRIPCRISRKIQNGMPSFKNVLRSSFKIIDDGIGEYYGFTLDGNGRYLLSDFQVTHNTLFAQSITHNLVGKEINVGWFTFEVTPARFLEKFKGDERALNFGLLPTEHRAGDLKWLFERIAEMHVVWHTRIFVIDHLHYLFDMWGSRNVSLSIGQVVRALKYLAVKGGFTIFLLCHYSKGQREENTDSYENIRDSSLIAQESDAVFLIRRMKDESGDYGEDALLTVEFHRRTGVMKRKVGLKKAGEFMYERILPKEDEPKKKSRGYEGFSRSQYF